MSVQNSAQVREMKTEMIDNRSLCVPVFLNGLGNFSVSFSSVAQYTPVEQFFKCRPVGVAPALGYFRYIFMSSEMIGEAVNKVIFAGKSLTLNLIPDGFPADPPFHKLAIFFLRPGSRSAELSEDPIWSEAGKGRFFPCGGPAAGPFPAFGPFDHPRADRIKNNRAAVPKGVCLFATVWT